MAEQKTKKTDVRVAEYINSLAGDKREDSLKLVELFQEVTNEEPKMWGTSIVGFGQYHYVYASGREGDWPLTAFSPRKHNLTLYIMTGFDDYADKSAYNPRPLLEQLGKYSIGKSCLYIKSLNDIDTDALKQLIKESYEQMKKTYKSP